MINKIYYVTYQTFPADTANSLQTISNIKYLLRNNMEINLIFPLRESGSSDSMEKINNHYGESLNFNIKGKKILILGAGGVVPSIIFALNKMNVSKIFISNRTKEKAEDLKSQFHNLEVLDWGDINDFDVIINATSLGLNKESINLDFSSCLIT